MKHLTVLATWLLCCTLPLGGCSPDDENASAKMGDQVEGDQASVPTNRIDIPPAVRQNLGISFITVEPRRVEQTLRVPGRFEYLPTAKREYRTMLPGRVNLLVEQFARVEAGAELYQIDSPGWRQLQRQITDEEATIERHTTRLTSFGPLREAHRNHEQRLTEVIAVRRERVTQLDEIAQAGGGRAAELNEARGAVATAEAQLAEVLETEAQLGADEAAARSDLSAAQSNRAFLLDSAATLVGVQVNDLVAEVDGPRGRLPRWRTIATIAVRATDSGVVESLGVTNGAWANEEVAVVTVVRPDRLRFHAVGLQSDLARLRDGLAARIVAPSPTRASGSIDLTDTMAGELAVGLAGDPNDRTLDLFVTPESLSSWARPGVSAQLEIVTDQTARPVMAIPSAAVQRDGLVPVYFLRDSADPNKAIRMTGDLGLDDGRWIVVKSGLVAGDEVVLDGAFQLMLASASSGQQEGGHFHADGTFHAGDD